MVYLVSFRLSSWSSERKPMKGGEVLLITQWVQYYNFEYENRGYVKKGE